MLRHVGKGMRRFEIENQTSAHAQARCNNVAKQVQYYATSKNVAEKFDHFQT